MKTSWYDIFVVRGEARSKPFKSSKARDLPIPITSSTGKFVYRGQTHTKHKPQSRTTCGLIPSKFRGIRRKFGAKFICIEFNHNSKTKSLPPTNLSSSYKTNQRSLKTKMDYWFSLNLRPKCHKTNIYDLEKFIPQDCTRRTLTQTVWSIWLPSVEMKTWW